MRKKYLCAMLTLMCAAGAQAKDTLYWFTFTGFNDSQGIFRPNARLTGTFVGDDADHDGVIRLDELKGLNTLTGSMYGCSNEVPYYGCAVDSFNYVIGGDLSFSAGKWTRDQMYNDVAGVTTGLNFYRNYSGWGHDDGIYYNYKWTPQTRLDVSLVPEPATYAMFGLGLLGVAMAARRRRQG